MRFLPLWLAQIIGDSEFQATVERIVRFIEEPVWERLSARALQMSSFELRGYVRARSALLVRQYVSAEVGENSSVSEQERLVEAIRSAVIQNMLGRVAEVKANQQTPIRVAVAA